MKEYKYEGEIFQIDDNKGCYVEVRYGGAVMGYVGVALDGGTSTSPYRYDYFRPRTGGFAYSAQVRSEGFIAGGGATDSLDEGLKRICGAYLLEVMEIRRRQEFDPEEACRSLHKQFEDLQQEIKD